MFSLTQFRFIKDTENLIHHENIMLEGLQSLFKVPVKVRKPKGYEALTGAERLMAYEDLYSYESKQKGSFVIRGKSDTRYNDDLALANLIIIDVDEKLRQDKPIGTPLEASKLLTELGINHWLHTSYSHMKTKDTVKYHIFIELNEPIARIHLRSNVLAIAKLLAPLNIAYAGEMNTWVQPWFLPRTPNTKAFEQYGYFDGNPFEANLMEPEEPDVRPEKNHNDADFRSLEEMHKNIRTGVEFHESLLNLTWQKAKMGQESAFTIAEYTEMLEASIERNAYDPSIVTRAERAIKELPDMVNDAITKVAKEQSGDDLDELATEADKLVYESPILPPGHLGEYLDGIYNTMFRQSRELAFVMGMSSVSTSLGAGFNADGSTYSGVNLAFILVGETGWGKSQMRKYLNMFYGSGVKKQIHQITDVKYKSFIGKNSYTSVKSLHDALALARAKVVILAEAGHTLGTDSNDVKLTGYSMETFVASAHDEDSLTAGYASKENNLELFAAPTLNLILESTEKVLHSRFNDMNALDSGYVTRQTVLKMPCKAKINRNRSKTVQLTPHACEQFANILAHSSTVQVCGAEELADKVLFGVFSNEQLDRIEAWEEEIESRYAIDSVAAKIATRLGHKVIKFATIATIFNHWTTGDTDIQDVELDWAIAHCEWELRQLDHNLTVAVNTDIYGALGEYIEVKLSHLISSRNSCLTERQILQGVVPLSTLTKQCNCTELTAIVESKRMPPRTIIKAQCEVLARDNKLVVLSKHSASGTRSECVKIKVKRSKK